MKTVFSKRAYAFLAGFLFFSFSASAQLHFKVKPDLTDDSRKTIMIIATGSIEESKVSEVGYSDHLSFENFAIHVILPEVNGFTNEGGFLYNLEDTPEDTIRYLRSYEDGSSIFKSNSNLTTGKPITDTIFLEFKDPCPVYYFFKLGKVGKVYWGHAIDDEYEIGDYEVIEQCGRCPCPINVTRINDTQAKFEVNESIEVAGDLLEGARIIQFDDIIVGTPTSVNFETGSNSFKAGGVFLGNPEYALSEGKLNFKFYQEIATEVLEGAIQINLTGEAKWKIFDGSTSEDGTIFWKKDNCMDEPVSELGCYTIIEE